MFSKIRIITFISLLSLAAALFAEGSSLPVERYALYVASTKGNATLADLRYPGSDAKKLADTMIEIGGVKKQNSFVLVDSSKEEIDGAFENISAIISSRNKKVRRTEFLFYYSGHSDEEALLLGDETYDYVSLKSTISSVPSDVHVVMLDSCFSGNFIRAKGGVKQKSFLVDDSSVVQGHAYLSSSSATEASQESDSIEASYFTNSLINGLRGAADTSGDNKVSLNELYYYAFNDTLLQTETSEIGPQHPSYNITLVGSGDLILTDISDADSMLIIRPEVEGRFLIRTLEGKLAAEINKAAGNRMTLALPAGFYSIIVVGPVYTGQAAVKLAEGEAYTLEENTLRRVNLKEGTARGPAPQKSEGPFDDAETQNVLNQARLNAGVEIPQTVAADSAQAADAQSEQAVAETAKPNQPAQSAQQEVIHATADIYDGTNRSSFDASDITLYSAENINGYVPFVLSLTPTICVPFNAKNAMVSVSPLVDIRNSVMGIQASGLLSLLHGKSNTAQVSGFMGIAEDDFAGAQVSGFMSISNHSFEGSQVSGFMNIADDVSGCQVAGFMNIAENVDGCMVSGFLNIARSCNGVAIGVINVIDDGIKDFSWGFYSGNWMLQYQGGTKVLHTTLCAATNSLFNPTLFIGSFGIGHRILTGVDYVRPIIDLEVFWNQMFFDGVSSIFDCYFYPSLRLSIGWKNCFFIFETQLEVFNWNSPAFNNDVINKSKDHIIFSNDDYSVHYKWGIAFRI